MDKMTYDFALQSRTYGSFYAPECEVTVGSFKMVSGRVNISEVIVDQAADGTAGGCRIRIVDFYNYASSSWDRELLSNLQVGAKLTVKMGYVRKKEVFFGYVDEYSYEFGDGTPPAIEISGLDGLGYLMSVRSRVFAGEKRIGDIVRQILQDSTAVGAAKSVTVSPTLKDMTVQRSKDGEDSYTFLNTLAKQTGMQLLCIDGEMIFDNVQKISIPVTTLDVQKNGLFSFTKRVSLANQPSKVIVHGRDKNNIAIKGEATSTTLSGDGKAAASVASKLLKKSVYEEDNPLAMTAEECKALAQARFDDMAQNYVFGSGRCVGMPEISAGRYVKLSGLEKTMNGSYFLTRVSHEYNDSGYHINFEVRGAKSR